MSETTRDVFEAAMGALESDRHQILGEWGSKGSDWEESDAEIASLRARFEAANGWRPIETAPKGGTRVWAWHGESPCGQDAVYWSTEDESWMTEDRVMIDPTHWRPLPEPPEAKP